MKNTMQVFHTAGVPPSSGVLSLPIMGWTAINRLALVNSVSAKTASIIMSPAVQPDALGIKGRGTWRTVTILDSEEADKGITPRGTGTRLGRMVGLSSGRACGATRTEPRQEARGPPNLPVMLAAPAGLYCLPRRRSTTQQPRTCSPPLRQ